MHRGSAGLPAGRGPSGFFGQSDNVVFRLEAYPGVKPAINGVPLYQRPYAAAMTFPFRVHGTQVRVWSDTTPISNARVYRLPAGESLAQPFADGACLPFRTDALGYLQGRGQLNLGDSLVALAPVTSTGAYTLYFTSAHPRPSA